MRHTAACRRASFRATNNLGCGSPDTTRMKFTCEASRQVSQRQQYRPSSAVRRPEEDSMAGPLTGTKPLQVSMKTGCSPPRDPSGELFRPLHTWPSPVISGSFHRKDLRAHRLFTRIWLHARQLHTAHVHQFIQGPDDTGSRPSVRRPSRLTLPMTSATSGSSYVCVDRHAFSQPSLRAQHKVGSSKIETTQRPTHGASQ